MDLPQILSPEKIQDYKQRLASLQRKQTASGEFKAPVQYGTGYSSSSRDSVFDKAEASDSISSMPGNRTVLKDFRFSDALECNDEQRNLRREYEAMAVTIEELTIENELFRNKANSFNAVVERARELKEKNEVLETQILVYQDENKKLERKIVELQELCESSQKDDTRYQNQIQKLKAAWYTEQEMLIRELEENKASVVAERIEMLNRIRAFEAERFGLLEESAKLKQKLRDAEQQLQQQRDREEQLVSEAAKERTRMREAHAADLEAAQARFARQAEELQSESIFAFEQEKVRQEARYALDAGRLQADVDRLTAERDQAQQRVAAAGKSIAELTVAKERMEHANRALEESVRQLTARLEQTNRMADRVRVQNEKLTRDIPARIEAVESAYREQIAKLQEEFTAARGAQGKLLRRMQARVERRNTEIAYLRRVWGTLLTSHPDLDRVEETTIREYKVVYKEKLALQSEVDSMREESTALAVMVAVQHLRLMLALWRKPLYLNTLKARHAKAAQAERVRELEELSRDLEEESGDATDKRLAFLRGRRRSLINGDKEVAGQALRAAASQHAAQGPGSHGGHKPQLSPPDPSRTSSAGSAASVRRHVQNSNQLVHSRNSLSSGGGLASVSSPSKGGGTMDSSGPPRIYGKQQWPDAAETTASHGAAHDRATGASDQRYKASGAVAEWGGGMSGYAVQGSSGGNGERGVRGWQ